MMLGFLLLFRISALQSEECPVPYAHLAKGLMFRVRC